MKEGLPLGDSYTICIDLFYSSARGNQTTYTIQPDSYTICIDLFYSSARGNRTTRPPDN